MWTRPRASDPGGEPSLTYTWSSVSAPAGGAVSFLVSGTNAAKQTTATFTRSGAYVVRVEALDAWGLNAFADLAITVQQTATQVAVTPATASTARSGTIAFTAAVTDQFLLPMATAPAITWSASGGTISSIGAFVAGSTPGTWTVTAQAAGRSGTAAVAVGNQPPVLTAGPSAGALTGTAVLLSVTASDDGGAANLAYSWTVLAPAPGSATFLPNSGNAASQTTMTVNAPGTWICLLYTSPSPRD